MYIKNKSSQLSINVLHFRCFAINSSSINLIIPIITLPVVSPTNVTQHVFSTSLRFVFNYISLSKQTPKALSAQTQHYNFRKRRKNIRQQSPHRRRTNIRSNDRAQPMYHPLKERDEKRFTIRPEIIDLWRKFFFISTFKLQSQMRMQK